MANRWGNNGNRDRLYFLGQCSADGDCSHDIKRCLLLGREAMRINRQYHNQPTLPTKVHVVKAVVFPVVIYGCESWTIKKAECRRIDLWCWRRLLRVSWTSRRFNQSILMRKQKWCIHAIKYYSTIKGNEGLTQPRRGTRYCDG